MPNYKKGTFWRRFAAYLIDSFIIEVTTIILTAVSPLGQGGNPLDYNGLLFWVLHIGYSTSMLVFTGATLGKQWMKLKVVSVSYGRVSVGSALLRESVGKFLSGIALNVGYMSALLDPKRRTWHDRLAKTYVVAVDGTGAMIPLGEEMVTATDRKMFWTLLIIGTGPLALFLFLFLYLFVVQPHQIKGSAMEPNYHSNAYYLTEKLSYRYKEPQRGDVVVYKAPNDPDVEYFKRIVGVPGDKIMFAVRRVYINGQLLVEPYLAKETQTFLFPGSIFQENTSVLVPEGMYVVLGDNRGHSSDSREQGFVPRENIIGKMTLCYWQCAGSR